MKSGEKVLLFVEEISLDVGIASYSAQVETLKRKLEQLETKKTIKQKNEKQVHNK